MEEQVNPLIIILLFVVRCGVPLLIMLGITYLFRRLGLIQEPKEPPEYNKAEETNGDLAHGKV